MKTKTQANVRKLTTVAIMSAIASVLMIFEFSVPLVPVFLKFDFANLPALLVSFSIGPLAGVTVELIRNAIHLPFSHTAFAGELANFIISAVFVATAGTVYKLVKNRKGAIIGSVSGALASALICLPVNYYISYPVFAKVFAPMDVIMGMYQAILPSVDSLWEALLIFNLPFTFVKGMICVIITFFIYKPLSPILKGSLDRKRK
ncbi:MAG: ECF transporter S component [Clostridia bacterium]|nr:ECF transporter S component [Clostridia bacterium]